MDTAAFDKFRESFTAFEEQVKAVRAGTKEVSTSFVGVSANAVRMWASVSHHTKTMAGNIASATRSLLRWAEIGGIISGLLGVGSLWGIDRLAIAAGNQRRNALGQNITPGEQRGFAATFGRLSDPGQFLGAVNAAMHDVTLRPGLYGAGLSESDIRGKDTGQVADSLVNALKKIADQTPESMMAQVLKARHLDQFITLEDFERYKHTPAAEIAGYQREYQARRRELELTKEQQKAWQGLQVQLHFAGMAIETSLIRALTPLAPQIKKLSEAFVGVFDAFAKNPEVAHWIDSLSDALGHFASYVGTPQFKQDISGFVTHVGEAALAIGSFAEWIYAHFPGLKPSKDYSILNRPDDTYFVPKPGAGNSLLPGAGQPGSSASRGLAPNYGPGSATGRNSWLPGAGLGSPISFHPGSTVAPSLREKEAHDFFRAAGWTEEQTAGLLANIRAESDFDPHNFTRAGGGQGAQGIAQWRGDRVDRFRKMFGHGPLEGTFEEQLVFMQWELENTEKAAGDQLRAARNARQSAAVVNERYERSGTGSGGRSQTAGAYQQKFRNSRTQVDIRNNTGGNATVTAAQLAT